MRAAISSFDIHISGLHSEAWKVRRESTILFVYYLDLDIYFSGYQVVRAFKEFQALHEKLFNQWPLIPNLPQPNSDSQYNHASALEKYLLDVLKSCSDLMWLSPQLLQFLEDSYGSSKLSVLQSKFFIRKVGFFLFLAKANLFHSQSPCLFLCK